MVNKTKNENASVEERILKAAEEEFLNKGFDGATTEAIARNAGVTHAMLHYYFRTKKNLFEKILNAKVDMLIKVIFGTFKSSGLPFRERITEAVKSHFDFIRKNPELPRFIINEFNSGSRRGILLDKKIWEIIPKLGEELQKAIDEESAKGVANRIDAINIIMDAVSLNIFPFLVLPFLKNIGAPFAEYEKDFLDMRREESIKVITGRLFNR